jgi:hypothetical protein
MNLRGDSIDEFHRRNHSISSSWSQDFLKLGGYAALLTRLNEILEVEWRYVPSLFTEDWPETFK